MKLGMQTLKKSDEMTYPTSYIGDNNCRSSSDSLCGLCLIADSTSAYSIVPRLLYQSTSSWLGFLGTGLELVLYSYIIVYKNLATEYKANFYVPYCL